MSKKFILIAIVIIVLATVFLGIYYLRHRDLFGCKPGYHKAELMSGATFCQPDDQPQIVD